ncbi:MAG: HNH endonuclease, partial [Xanthobacteraceae bacterium]
MSDIKQYLLDHVRKEPGRLGDDCWIWTLSLSEGYGQVYWNGFGGRAHRMSYQVFVGPILAGRQVQHKCDRKDCINPTHLRLGTQVADCLSRGDPELTPQEFERLCNELADLDRNASLSDLRRRQIETQLRGTIRNHCDERRTEIKKYRSAMRLQRKALNEQREQERKEQRAERLSRLSPEALAKLKASIAGVKECTKEELRQEAIEAQLKKKQDMAWRRWKPRQARTAIVALVIQI